MWKMNSESGRSKQDRHPDWMWTHWRKGRRFKCSGTGLHGRDHVAVTDNETPTNYLPAQHPLISDPIIQGKDKSANELVMPSDKSKKKRGRSSNWMWTYQRKRRPKTGSRKKKSSLPGKTDLQMEEGIPSEDPEGYHSDQGNSPSYDVDQGTGDETEEETAVDEMQILFKCPFCLLIYPGADELIQHLTTHDRDYPPSQDKLNGGGSSPQTDDDDDDTENDHYPTSKPTPDRKGPFPCELCGKEFTRKVHLLVHDRIHTGDRPFPCPSCGQRFRQKSHLQRHMRAFKHGQQEIHGSSFKSVDKKRISAKSKSMKTKTQLQKHGNVKKAIKKVSIVHSQSERRDQYHVMNGKGGYPCQFCGRKFAIKHNLLAHIRIHTGYRPFPCPSHCKKRFRQKAHLQKHLRSVHGMTDEDVRSLGKGSRVAKSKIKPSQKLIPSLPPPCKVMVTRCDHLIPFYLSAKAKLSKTTKTHLQK